MTSQEQFQALIQKYQDGTCSPREKQLLESWYNVKAVNNPDVDLHTGYWLDKIKRLRKILAFVIKHINKVFSISLPIGILLIAASITVLVGIWTVLFKNDDTLPVLYANDVAPGKNKATLTLQNGKTIQLDNAIKSVVIEPSKLSYSDGELINNEISETFTVATPKGGTFRVRLPDSSMAWLNAASSLTYTPPTKENGATRNIKLFGEAYFEVYKDKKRPFVVTTDKQKIEVLGTHFNVSAYHDELSTKTTLLEGSVRVAPLSVSGDQERGITLIPNQELTMRSNDFQIRKVDPDEVISWKNGDFTFAGESLKSIMLKVARWYDVEVIYTDPKIGIKQFNGTISRFKNISQVLCLLEKTGEVKFKIEGRRITVMH